MGINGAVIYVFGSGAIYGLKYVTAPTETDSYIFGVSVYGTSTNNDGYGFLKCINLINCTGIGKGIGTDGDFVGFDDCINLINCVGIGTGSGTGSSSVGFISCKKLTNCTGTGAGTGTSSVGYGFTNCENLSNCIGTGTAASDGKGFSNCSNLANCQGKGIATGGGTGEGYSFYTISRASNCNQIATVPLSTTAMWGGNNIGIDVDTCCYSAVQVSNATLNA